MALGPADTVDRAIALKTVVVLALAVCSAGCSRPPSLDEDGGYVLVFQLESPTTADSPSIVRALRKRLEQTGYSGAAVRMLDDGRFEITLPGADEQKLAMAKRLVSAGGMLEFRILAKRGPDDAIIAEATAEDVEEEAKEDGEPSSERRTEREAEKGAAARWVRYDAAKMRIPPGAVTRNTEGAEPQVLILLDKWNLTGVYLTNVFKSRDGSGKPAIDGTFSKRGEALIKAMTSRNLPSESGEARSLGIILDGQLLTAPQIRSQIGKRFQITGRFTDADADAFVAILRVGRLPARLDPEPISEIKVEPKP